jgi:phosphohistidine phosphatase
MQRLILMRHAKAETKSDSGQDFDRPLSARGRREAKTMGQVLAEAGLTPDIALVSSALRTCETWELGSTAFPLAGVEFSRDIYNGSPMSILEMAQNRPESVVLVVGHNPTLHDLALELLRDGATSAAVVAKVQSRFPPATAVAFNFDAADRPAYDGFFLVADHGDAP